MIIMVGRVCKGIEHEFFTSLLELPRTPKIQIVEILVAKIATRRTWYQAHV